MPFLVTCSCGKKLRVADETEGKKVRCPACGSLVVARNESDPAPAAKRPRDEEPDDEERPARKPARKADPDDDEEAPARPRRKKAARDDDDEDDRPARKEKKKGPKVWLWVVGGCGSLLFLGCGGLVVLALALGGKDTGRQATGGAVAANPPRADGLSVTDVPFDAKNVLPCLFWADPEGGSFWALEETGKLSRVSYPDFKTTVQKDFGRKVSWLSPSAEGLLVSVADKGEVWVVDPDKLEVKKTIAVPGVNHAVSAPGLSVAAAYGETTQPVKRPFFSGVDLKTGQSTPFEAPKGMGIFGLFDAVVTPDGKYVFALLQTGDMYRCHFQGGQIKLDEQRGSLGNGYKVQVSPDSKFVCLPSPGGTPNPGNKAYATLVFPTTSFKQTECLLEQGSHPHVAAFDPAAGFIYADNDDFSLIVFTMGGLKKHEYKVGEKLDSGNPVRQYLVHPAGKKLVLLGGGKMYHVKVPD